MKKHIVHYKDKLGRNNQCELFGKDEHEVKDKFSTLYAECVLIEIAQ